MWPRQLEGLFQANPVGISPFKTSPEGGGKAKHLMQKATAQLNPL